MQLNWFLISPLIVLSRHGFIIQIYARHQWTGVEKTSPHQRIVGRIRWHLFPELFRCCIVHNGGFDDGIIRIRTHYIRRCYGMYSFSAFIYAAQRQRRSTIESRNYLLKSEPHRDTCSMNQCFDLWNLLIIQLCVVLFVVDHRNRPEATSQLVKTSHTHIKTSEQLNRNKIAAAAAAVNVLRKCLFRNVMTDDGRSIRNSSIIMESFFILIHVRCSVGQPARSFAFQRKILSPALINIE